MRCVARDWKREAVRVAVTSSSAHVLHIKMLFAVSAKP
jgi:hypothetical protein